MKQSENDAVQGLADRLMRLHWALEERRDRGTDWSVARSLEDRIGAGQYFSDDIARAKQLLDKHGF